MAKLIDLGRVLYAIALMFFGVQYLIYAAGRTWPVPGPPFSPGNLAVAAISGIALLAAGVCIAIAKQARLASGLVAVAFLGRALVIHLPKLVAKIHDPSPWTLTAETVALGAGALLLVGALAKSADRRSIAIGRFLFAISLIVFAVQHFMYAKFLATLIPTWIPGRLFLASFVGVAFVAASAAIMRGKLDRLASVLLGVMFGTWVLILHLPRVLAALHDSNGWTSMFIALAMCGCSLILAGSMRIHASKAASAK